MPAIVSGRRHRGCHRPDSVLAAATEGGRDGTLLVDGLLVDELLVDGSMG